MPENLIDLSVWCSRLSRWGTLCARLYECMKQDVLTTSQAEEDILRTYQLHANCFITKPVDLNQFMRVVQSIEEFWFTVVRLVPNSDGKR